MGGGSLLQVPRHRAHCKELQSGRRHLLQLQRDWSHREGLPQRRYQDLLQVRWDWSHQQGVPLQVDGAQSGYGIGNLQDTWLLRSHFFCPNCGENLKHKLSANENSFVRSVEFSNYCSCNDFLLKFDFV